MGKKSDDKFMATALGVILFILFILFAKNYIVHGTDIAAWFFR